MIDVKFTIGEETQTFSVEQGANLLSGAIEAGVPVEYVCKSGRCCTCKVKVLAGEKNLSAPTPSEALRLGRDKLKRNWRLACQASVNGPAEVVHNVFLGVGH
ncbi:MAG TPA: 2Fe-2S iron-sulfur cluster-binding protein [Pantanalinema sp.]